MRQSVSAIRTTSERMKNGLNMVIFPEGTKADGIIPALETACGKSPVSVAVNGFILPAEG